MKVGGLMNNMEIQWSKALFSHDVVEILFWDFPSIWSCSLQHVLKLLDIHGLSKFFGDSADVIGVDGASVVIIKQVEDFVNTVLNKLNWIPLIIYLPIEMWFHLRTLRTQLRGLAIRDQQSCWKWLGFCFRSRGFA